MSSNAPHRINLSRMWWPVTLEIDEREKRWCDLAAIVDSACPEFNTAIRLARNFNRPTQLTNESQVHLHFQNMPPGMQYFFNQEQLDWTDGDDLRWDISKRLENRNRIDIVGDCVRIKAFPVGQGMTGNPPQLWLELT